MRLMFKKGMTPEQIANFFLQFVDDNNLIIGTVNMYIQTFGEDMRAEKFNNSDYLMIESADKAKYSEYETRIRRERMRCSV